MNGRLAGPTAAPELEYEMTFTERIEGPLGPTIGVPSRLCWKIAEAALSGPRITASLAMPGTDWIRVEGSGIRRQDQRTQFLTDDGTLIRSGSGWVRCRRSARTGRSTGWCRPGAGWSSTAGPA